MGAFAEFERALIRERQREGMALARGAYQGHQPSLQPDQTWNCGKKAQAGTKKAGLAREYGISRETVYHYLRS